MQSLAILDSYWYRLMTFQNGSYEAPKIVFKYSHFWGNMFSLHANKKRHFHRFENVQRFLEIRSVTAAQKIMVDIILFSKLM